MGRKGRFACILILNVWVLESVCADAEKDMTYMQDVQGNIHADKSECKLKISLTTKPTPSKTPTQNFREVEAQKGSQGDKGDVVFPGLPGIPGEKGNKGDTGFRGPKGEGFSGPKGDKGDRGDMGSQGPQGLQGSKGEGITGAKGDKGDIGSPGSQGANGIPGEKGDKGDTGFEGAKGEAIVGPKGDKGDRGDTGLQGPVGPQGPKGEGITGAKGNQGDAGLPGLQMKGDKGDIGSEGAKGIPGEKGDKGDTGLEGPKGEAISGPKGDKGDMGDTGSQGPQGPQGPKGEGVRGAKGNQGDAGLPGLQVKGDKGDIGSPGSQGAEGIPGEKGNKGDRGLQGPKGEGTQGPKGEGIIGPKGQKGDSCIKGEMLDAEMEKHPLGRFENPMKSCAMVTIDVSGNFYVNPPDKFEVICNTKKGETCLDTREMPDEEDINEDAITLNDKPLWLSEIAEFDLDDFYKIRLPQIAYLQRISIGVKQKIRFNCYNVDLISSKGEPLLLSLWNGLISRPTSSADNPISYKIESNTCTGAAKDTWASAVITLETKLINRLPVVDFYITDIRRDVEQKVYMHLEDLCFTYYKKP